MKDYILCAVRGGPESRATVTKAIDLALKQNARLVFFHVLNAEFLEHATVGPLSVVYSQMNEMGQFMLLILVDRAKRRGVEEVEYVMREGDIRKQLIQAAIDTRSKVLVMGQPVRSPGSNVFKKAEIGDFVRELEEMGHLRVELVTPDS